ncbi:MAG: hypothetical protein LBV06_00590, partial [Propionibacteriaceae bacterium]|nr:hypothetical protein [Propionibacteriaceae bacterium]
MLKRVSPMILSLFTAISAVIWLGSQAHAECTSQVESHARYSGDVTVTATSSCLDDTVSTEPDSAPVTADEPPASECHDDDGNPVPCWNGDLAWNPDYDTYCRALDQSDPNPAWQGTPITIGPRYLPYQCQRTDAPTSNLVYWLEDTPDTPVKPDSPINPEAIVHTMVDTLQLHPPVPGDGGFIYPNATDW